MGAKIRFDKDTIISKALEYVNQNGIENLSARNLSSYLGCSTQPLFRVFSSIEELKEDLYLKILDFKNNFSKDNSEQYKDEFLAVGMTYIKFAKIHPNLFYVLFIDSKSSKTSLDDFLGEKEDIIISELSQRLKTSKENSLRLYKNLWLISHGIACLIYTGQLKFNEKEIKTTLQESYSSFLKSIK